MSDTFDDSGAPRAHRGVACVPTLLVVLECDRPLAGSARHSLEDVDQVTIGRGDERAGTRSDRDGTRTLDVRIPARSMSAAHARLVRVGTFWAVEDLGSHRTPHSPNARQPSLAAS